jgi:redox-sensitive bicupin YhaK (pirin superfamily)
MPQIEDSMVVAAHPHTGLQTVTWLLEGSVEHRDSLGTIQHIEPGQLNLMTAGNGIAHSELSIGKDQTKYNGNMHGVQLWVALPENQRNEKPFFEHHSELPNFNEENINFHLFAGTYQGHTAPTTLFTPLLGAQLQSENNQASTIPLNLDFEHAILALTGNATINGQEIKQGQAIYLAPYEHDQLTIQADPQTKLLLLGGEPFEEQIVMWWNFIARTNDEIVKMRTKWNTQQWLPQFPDQIGGYIPAPELPNVTLRAR